MIVWTCPRCGHEVDPGDSLAALDAMEGYCRDCRDWTGRQVGNRGRPSHYDYDGQPIPASVWVLLLGARTEDAVRWRVAVCDVGDYEVSTVWLGLDHGWRDDRPLIFETMVFGPSGEGEYVERYSTAAEAEAGHWRWVERMTAQSEALGALDPDAERERNG